MNSLEQRTRWFALAVIVTAQFMVVLDVAIVNVASPSIKTDLHFSQESLQWVVTAYAITFGGFLMLGGRFADLLGRRRMFVTGIALFTVSSALCGLASSEAQLVVFRGIQGLGGALFAPAGLSLLMTTFAAGRDRNLALGIWGAASGSGAAVGVLLGGVLTSYLSWPWVFYLNVPVGLALVVLAPRYLAESRAPAGGRHFDVAGSAAVTAALMVLVYGLTRATQNGWGSPVTLALFATAAALAGIFALVERRAESPILPMHVFRGSTLATASIITSAIASIAFSQFFLLTLYLQQVLHYSPARTGLAFATIAVTVAVMSNVSQRLVTGFGPRRVLFAGLLFAAASELLLARLPVHGQFVTDLLPSFILIGVGMGVSFVAVTIAALAGVEPADAGIASGLVNTSRQVGGALGLAAVTTIATIYAGHPATRLAAEAAATRGYRVGFGVLAGVALAAALLTPRMRVRAESVEEIDVEDEALVEAA
jgi:EmrB/QacA subfamily drug resistance transporter